MGLTHGLPHLAPGALYVPALGTGGFIRSRAWHRGLYTFPHLAPGALYVPALGTGGFIRSRAWHRRPYTFPRLAPGALYVPALGTGGFIRSRAWHRVCVFNRFATKPFFLHFFLRRTSDGTGTDSSLKLRQNFRLSGTEAGRRMNWMKPKHKSLHKLFRKLRIEYVPCWG